jgi:hypothetical protein
LFSRNLGRGSPILATNYYHELKGYSKVKDSFFLGNKEVSKVDWEAARDGCDSLRDYSLVSG